MATNRNRSIAIDGKTIFQSKEGENLPMELFPMLVATVPIEHTVKVASNYAASDDYTADELTTLIPSKGNAINVFIDGYTISLNSTEAVSLAGTSMLVILGNVDSTSVSIGGLISGSDHSIDQSISVLFPKPMLLTKNTPVTFRTPPRTSTSYFVSVLYHEVQL